MLGKDAKGNDLSKQEKKKYYDKFLANSSSDNNPKKKVTFFPQTIDDPDDKNKKIPYFISHSAMREWEYEWLGMLPRNKVFPTIYSESYRNIIMYRILEKSKFGRY
ncbi:hypothetical protein HYE54_01345 [Aggregatibacter actinomycetemcomitans]|nr:hypothetical protein [Aggregatibacter actinomycetemcomitans]MBN6085491.1 hypothetical protein [Aggregatibacter actinomycetemcomitans]